MKTIPYVHVDYNCAPVTVAYYRITPTGRPTTDWHIVTLPRYNRESNLVTVAPGSFSPYARPYKLSQPYGHIRTLADIPMTVATPPKLPAHRGRWSAPLFREFTPPEVENAGWPLSWLATNSGAL